MCRNMYNKSMTCAMIDLIFRGLMNCSLGRSGAATRGGSSFTLCCQTCLINLQRQMLLEGRTERTPAPSWSGTNAVACNGRNDAPAESCSGCGEEEVGDYKEKRMETMGNDPSAGAVWTTMISGPRGPVCNSHYGLLLLHSGFEDHHDRVELGRDEQRACSYYSHRTELSLKTDGMKEWRYRPELKGQFRHLGSFSFAK